MSADAKKPELTLALLHERARVFAKAESRHDEPTLYGVSDGKAVGTYLEGKFVKELVERYSFTTGSAAKGIDLPELKVEVKTTSIRQPQSSSPFSSARQKIYGLGYSLLVFVYEKTDYHKTATSRLNILHVIFIDKSRTADYQLTRGLLQILDNDGNEDDLVAFMQDKMLPVDDVEATRLASELLQRRPVQGYLTISNALQWRLQYRRVIKMAGEIDGIMRIQ